MFAFTLATATLVLLPAALALPPVARQSTPAWCEGLGWATFDEQTDFTIKAFAAAPGGGETGSGQELVVVPYSSGAAIAYGVLVTAASYPASFTTFNLTAGGLAPIDDASNEQRYYSASNEVNGVPTFEWSFITPVEPSAQIYCGIANTSPSGYGNPCPVLAIDNDYNNFYLCTNQYGWSQLVHGPSAAGAAQQPTYDQSTCQQVFLHIEDESCGA